MPVAVALLVWLAGVQLPRDRPALVSASAPEPPNHIALAPVTIAQPKIVRLATDAISREVGREGGNTYATDGRKTQMLW